MSTLDILRIASDFMGVLILPTFGMMFSVQRRISTMEGELKALYSVIELLAKKD